MGRKGVSKRKPKVKSNSGAGASNDAILAETSPVAAVLRGRETTPKSVASPESVGSSKTQKKH